MLSPGARIAVVAPSGIFDPLRLAAGIERVRSWGYEPIEAPHLHARHRYLAGTAEERTADLCWALTSDDVDAVWFARGGYGTVQTLSAIDWDAVPPKRPVIGFSDATALFSAMLRYGCGIAVHGPVLHSLADHADEPSRERLRALLAGEPTGGLAGRRILGSGQVKGRLVGGNLCVLGSLVGTPWALDATDGIVLLEEIAEQPYKVDRLITQLALSGALDGARGIVLGEFRRCDPPEEAGWTLRDVLVDALAPLGVPVLAGLPVGHGPANHALVLGQAVRITDEGLHVVEAG